MAELTERMQRIVNHSMELLNGANHVEIGPSCALVLGSVNNLLVIEPYGQTVGSPYATLEIEDLDSDENDEHEVWLFEQLLGLSVPILKWEPISKADDLGQCATILGMAYFAEKQSNGLYHAFFMVNGELHGIQKDVLGVEKAKELCQNHLKDVWEGRIEL